MARRVAESPTALIDALVRDAVNLQMLFDQAHQEQRRRIAHDLHEALSAAPAPLPPAATELLQALEPARLAVRSFEVSCTVRVAHRKTRRLEVGLTPLNVGFAARYGSDSRRESSLKLVVEQVPLPYRDSGKENPHGQEAEQDDA